MMALHTTPLLPAGQQNIHALWLRLAHWINALAILIMVTSGWQIYNASPLFDFEFSKTITLGGWLGGAIQWHFAGMWLFGINGLFYLLMNVATGRLQKKFFPVTPRALWDDLLAAVKGKLAHNDLRHYNTVQRVAYLFVMADGVLLVVSGLVVWKSVQFPLLRTLMGGFDAARYVHFFAMSAMVGFVAVHLIMVMLVPRTLLAMLRGR
ncbi:cytochrome b/b6 domain-containing protein [Rouxiella badensis]|jgi:thiosulfate reductase cytochrome b subunit|nr:cytochrome b/b6 domain-containing protein [Rouxiella badensis]MCC3705378.1 cytochrome b/b6 domain-containing protein [Rouxiella badensis]MCC3719470.1 cytochrome b/b6 domain-containing protein [Rouxiella badensis]MCC3728720.1 cytochrome b/b6 domain-containing protein [Rouxiella badensis]MCC3733146.1 cytochrome b/b6 domain-containing protein [Rouxiella badensis]MCC3741084.1 cytochrome b/b6 domain-containing protein [Rouxiella badensis]